MDSRAIFIERCILYLITLLMRRASNWLSARAVLTFLYQMKKKDITKFINVQKVQGKYKLGHF